MSDDEKKQWALETVETLNKKKQLWRENKSISKAHRDGGKRILEGVSYRTGLKILEAVFYLTMGYSKKEVSGMLGHKPDYVSKLQMFYPDAFHKARAILVKETLSEYGQNLVLVKGALSRAAPVAVKTLIEIMEDKSVPANFRRHAAVDTLNLLFGGEANSGARGENKTVNVGMINLIENAVKEVEAIDGSYIVDAEEADEVTSDDETNQDVDSSGGD